MDQAELKDKLAALQRSCTEVKNFIDKESVEISNISKHKEVLEAERSKVAQELASHQKEAATAQSSLQAFLQKEHAYIADLRKKAEYALEQSDLKRTQATAILEQAEQKEKAINDKVVLLQAQETELEKRVARLQSALKAV